MGGFWVGTYTGELGRGRGIYHVRDGSVWCVAEVDSPSYLALHPNGDVLYIVSEGPDGAVLAFEVVGDDGLRPLGAIPVPGSPCHVTVSPSGRELVVASYASGTFTFVPLDEKGRFTGQPSVVEGKGNEPHAHQAAYAPDGTILVVDLGANLIRAFRPGGAEVRDVCLSVGCGPRHLVVHPVTGFVHVLAELAGIVITLRAEGGDYSAMTVIGDSPSTASGAGEGFGAAIKVSADGRWVYTSTRGPDVITTHEVTGETLRPVADVPCGGTWPRDLHVDGHKLLVANERSNAIAVFSTTPETGVPTPTETWPIPSPTCIIPATQA